MGYNPKDFQGRSRRGQSQAIHATMREQFPQPSGHPIHMAGTDAVADHVETKRERMNGWEGEYNDQLELRRRDGEILWFDYEVMRLEIADGSWWKFDFLVKFRDGRIEIHEIKGWMRREDRVKIRAAAAKYPIPIFVVSKSSGRFTIERVKAA
jgi:hypothetical protein